MQWQVSVELTGEDGRVAQTVVATGERIGLKHTADSLGLTLAEGKAVLAGLQEVLVRAQVAEHCAARRRCPCGSLRPVKDYRSRRLVSLFGTVEVRAPRLGPCRCGTACRRSLTPVAEIMPDRCTPEYERILALMGSSLPYRQAQTLLGELLPLAASPDVETVRQHTLKVGERLERMALAPPAPSCSSPPDGMVLAIDGGHVSSVKTYQTRSFEVLIARVAGEGAQGEEKVFSTMPAEAVKQIQQLQHLMAELGATPDTPVTILSDGAEHPRRLGEKASRGPTRHVLDWFHLSMRVQHVAQAVAGWMTAVPEDRERTTGLADAVERIRWRLWHGQVERALDLIGETLAPLTATDDPSPAKKVIKLLGALETYVSGHAGLIIDYAKARQNEEPISTSTTESTVQRLLHRRMGMNQQMRWSPSSAHLMLKVRTAAMNGSLTADHVAAERFAQRPYRRAA